MLTPMESELSEQYVNLSTDATIYWVARSQIDDCKLAR